MAKTVKFRRGGTADVASFVGVEGELIVDVDKVSLSVHDGKLAGGRQVVMAGDKVAAATLADTATLATSATHADAATKADSATAADKATLADEATVADKFKTPVDIAFTGDATGTISKFDGSAAATAKLSLATTGVTAGTYNSVTVNDKGLVTAASNVSVGGTASPYKWYWTTDKTFGYLGTMPGGTSVASANKFEFTFPAGIDVRAIVFYQTAENNTNTNLVVTYDKTSAFTPTPVVYDADNDPLTGMGCMPIVVSYQYASDGMQNCVASVMHTTQNQLWVCGANQNTPHIHRITF